MGRRFEYGEWPRLAVLSPHFDDAVFSLALILRRLANRGVALAVHNVFTRSAYAPCLHAGDDGAEDRISRVSVARSTEDGHALRATAAKISRRNHGLWDFPIRTGRSWQEVCRETDDVSDQEETIVQVAGLLHLCRGWLVAVPLGLGNHADHLVVREAAMRVIHPARLHFYEDLPYASRQGAAAIAKRVTKTGERTGLRLRAMRVPAPRASEKKRLAARYRSQITCGEARAIAAYRTSDRRRERLWAPAGSPLRLLFLAGT